MADMGEDAKRASVSSPFDADFSAALELAAAPPEVIALGATWGAKWPTAPLPVRRVLLWVSRCSDAEIIALDDLIQSQRPEAQP
ncbi:hypothetical protein ABMY26_36465 (plasmid) [Azospirillum sp. HJ39]|uniref:hypothetical protein n=1 Tax=Azospirillum sp. HJ39 TaxID=3159496 RepID=UPI003557E8B6